jgi:four helix bundle protein
MESTATRSHRDLIVWQRAIELAVQTHHATASFPKQEMFGLSSQVRRAAASVPANLAEGSARRTTREFIAFAHFARGSLAELETHLVLAHRVHYLDDPTFESLVGEIGHVGRLMNGLIRGLREREAARRLLSGPNS